MPLAEGNDYSGTRTTPDYASDARPSGPAIIVRASDIHSFLCFAARFPRYARRNLICQFRAIQYHAYKIYSEREMRSVPQCNIIRRICLFLWKAHGNTGKWRHGIIKILVKLQILWGSPSLHSARSREISERKMDEIKEFIISRLLSPWIKNYGILLRRFLESNLTEREREAGKRPVSISPSFL